MKEMDRRGLLGRGAATLAMTPQALRSDAALAAQPPQPGNIRSVVSRELLRSLPGVVPGDVLYLAEAGREGMFACRAGAPTIADRLEGLQLASRAQPVHFARIWDGTHGRPEWFGARVNDGRVDCADAIEACYTLCPHTQLGQADYFIRRTLRFDRSWRTLRGVGNYATDQGRGTRIILQGSAPGVHTADLMVVGSVEQPARTNDRFPFENHFSNFTLIRDGRSAPHPSGDIRRYPTGLRAAYLVRSTFREITSLASSVGFYLGGLTYTKVDDCLAQRLEPGLGGGADLAVGFFLDGAPNFGLAGGNASLYLDRCVVVGQHPSHRRPTGLLARGAFVDTFLDRFESAQIDTGVAFDARGAGSRGQTVDVHIRGAVLDGCARHGLDLDLTGTSSASVEVVDPYVYAPASGGDRGVFVHDGAGLVTITGGQVHGAFANGSLALSATRGVRVQGLKLHEAVRPVVVADAGGLVLEPQITNIERRTDGFAIACAAMYRSIVRPIVVGAPGAFAGGVSLDAACNYSSLDGTAIDPGCFREVTGARKLWFAGGDATQGAGALAFGRRFNVVTGVLG
jgi:hypothetical protein